MILKVVVSIQYVLLNVMNPLAFYDSLRTGRSHDRIPMKGRFSAPVQGGPGAHQAPVQWVTRLFPGGEAVGAWHWA